MPDTTLMLGISSCHFTFSTIPEGSYYQLPILQLSQLGLREAT